MSYWPAKGYKPCPAPVAPHLALAGLLEVGLTGHKPCPAAPVSPHLELAGPLQVGFTGHKLCSTPNTPHTEIAGPLEVELTKHKPCPALVPLTWILLDR